MRKAGAAALAVALLLPGCGGDSSEKHSVAVDGSSTVAPIAMGAAELFWREQPSISVTVGVSGTGGGFKKFLEDRARLRTDISNASRPIDPKEIALAAKRGVQFIELPVAYDGIAVVMNPDATFCDHLTVEELKAIWSPGSKINNWKDVRPGFPDLEMKLYGPGTDSGTFDYFTQVINGKEKSSRADYTQSEDDNMLVQGVAGDRGALGYFGFSYYEDHKSRLRLLAVSRGDGKPVLPSAETIHNQSYDPLSRPLFVYVNAEAARRPEVKAFMHFFFDHAPKIVEHPKVNYVALDRELYEMARARLDAGVTGTAFEHGKRKTLWDAYGVERRATSAEPHQ